MAENSVMTLAATSFKNINIVVTKYLFANWSAQFGGKLIKFLGNSLTERFPVLIHVNKSGWKAWLFS